MKKRFLVTSILMLLLTVFALSTSTYAWFSMNTQVSATGMQVVAKTDDTFLLIGTVNNPATIQTANSITTALTVEYADAKLLASRPCLTAAEVTALNTAGLKVDGNDITTDAVQVTNTATAAAVTNWYTAKANLSSASTVKSGTERQLINFDGYVITKTVYLTVAVGANPAINLTVTPTITAKDDGDDLGACKVIVTTSDGGFAELNSGSGETDIKGSNTPLTSSATLTVNIYIYYDGSHESVYTNNVADLKGANISLAFDVDASPAA